MDEYQELARFKLPIPMQLLGKLCGLYEKQYKDAVVELQTEWAIVKLPIKKDASHDAR